MEERRRKDSAPRGTGWYNMGMDNPSPVNGRNRKKKKQAPSDQQRTELNNSWKGKSNWRLSGRAERLPTSGQIDAGAVYYAHAVVRS